MKDGGPAFPISLRDLMAIMFGTARVHAGLSNDPELLSEVAYKMADAMLAEREK